MRNVRYLLSALLLTLGVFSLARSALHAQELPPTLASLKGFPVPEPANLSDFVSDRTAAIQLGKALFWDTQVGSDGVQACATCHFQAGADNRVKNQINPGLNAGDTTFQTGKPNYILTGADFPLTKLTIPDDPNSPLVRDSNDVISSQGVYRRDFNSVIPGKRSDVCAHIADTVFNVAGIDVRRVEPRNAPTMINAIFNFRNFWDGRANNIFNGVNPFGPRDPNATLWKAVGSAQTLTPVVVAIPNASLASQAVGPPGSFFEMACANRPLAQIGRKLLNSNKIPLAKQKIDPTDSVLGGLVASAKQGKSILYADMVRKAFRSEWWASPATIGAEQYTQMEANFSLFFGLSIQLYEATLVSDDAPLDRYLQGQTTALTPRQQQGLALFQGEARCIQCHNGPELTRATVSHATNERLERMIMAFGGCAVYDNGFYNIGVRPTTDDRGIGGNDPFGNPLSDTLMAFQGKFSDPNLDPPLGDINWCDSRASVQGAFKTPSLRNVELTGPYFHNGGKATLRQVVDAYSRGGDFGAQNIDNLDPDIERLGLSDESRTALVDFLLALTDERVRWEKAPFDHPALCIPEGSIGDTTFVAESKKGSGEGQDQMRCIPAVGAAGNKTPLRPFLNLNPFSQDTSSASATVKAAEDTSTPASPTQENLVYLPLINH